MKTRIRTLFSVLLSLHFIFLSNATFYTETGDLQKHYMGYSVFRIVPTNDEDLENLRTLVENQKYQLDFWKEPTTVNQAVDVMVPPEGVPFVEQYLSAKHIPRTILLYDVERLIMNEKLDRLMMPSGLTARHTNTFFSTYKSLQEIYDFLGDLAAESPSIASLLTIGKSSEGRNLQVIKIGSPSKNDSKPSIWIDGGIHAREWISPATVTYIAQSLVTEYNINNDTKQLVDHFDFYILPVLNPDGYVYTQNVNRLWRKSRNGVRIFCKGIDLNRNFGYHWREGGSSANPCSETYSGLSAFSEPETRALSTFLLERKGRFIAYLAVHSYSQLWLTPWGWTSELPDDYEDMISVAKAATEALYKVHGTRYRTGSSTNVLYKATGGADDWAYGVAGIKYSYTLELRDTGRYGFLLPAEHILPTGEETFAGIKAMAQAIQKDTASKHEPSSPRH